MWHYKSVYVCERGVNMSDMNNILEVRNITKTYPGVVALNDVSIAIQKGEIHAIIGENGAGKSTLIKIITGAIEQDKGSIEFEGTSYEKMSPALSREIGIEAIYQEFNLAPTVSVAENIYIGYKVNDGVVINYKKLYQEAEKVLSHFTVKIDPKMLVKDLTVAYMQLVEIAKAIARNAKLIIMDEPTAPLTEDEVENLFVIIRQLKSEGVSIIYISHRLDELFAVSDRVTVMRDGAVVSTQNTKEFTKDELIYHMVGRELRDTYPTREVTYGETILEVKNISGNGVRPISFSVRKGEVLGFAGLVGAGRTELARLIFGADRKDSGEIYVDGKKVSINHPKDSLKYGISLVSEDRKEQGVFLKMSIATNITVTILEKLSNWIVIDKKREIECVNEYKDALNIKTPSIEQLVGNLSGGNQQKVALSKWLASKSKLLILDEPTRGIDVGAKQEIYQLINKLASEGLGIIVISSEMEEILGMADRIMVLAEGKLAGELNKEEFSQMLVLKYASGEQ